MIYLSWFCFVAAITFTVVSFFTSQKALEDQLDYARRYYLDYEDEVLGLNSKFNKATNWINIAGIIFLLIGLILNSLFVFINYERVNTMSNKIIGAMDGAIVNKMQSVSLTTKGATTIPLQAIPVNPQGGAVIPSMQKLPSTLPKTTDK